MEAQQAPVADKVGNPAKQEPAARGQWVLPQSGAALRLVEDDFVRAARELGVETAAIHAVASVESGGRTGFDAKKRPKILFEPAHFHKFTHGRYDKSHPHISIGGKGPAVRRAIRATYRRDQWGQMHEAFALDPVAALQSASWGMFQVLGSNSRMCGWATVQQFVDSMFYSEGQHLRAFLGYCRGANLVRHLKTHNWAAFAAGYNGSGYREFHYDTKMAHAYQQYAHR